MIVEISHWAQSTNNRPIALFASQSLLTIRNRQPIVFIGGIHGDEPEGIALAESLLAWLKNHSSNVSLDWILIPCLNVDGAQANERTNGRGVDLNRNFPSQDWNAEHRAPRYYPGPVKASEMETQALVQLIMEVPPQLIVHFHSWKPAVVFAGPAKHMAPLYLVESSGYPLQEDIGYPTPGSLGQWAWLDLQIPVICTEEREGASQQDTWTRFGPGLKKILGQVDPPHVK